MEALYERRYRTKLAKLLALDHAYRCVTLFYVEVWSTLIAHVLFKSFV
jgi:hypothetical protein